LYGIPNVLYLDNNVDFLLKGLSLKCSFCSQSYQITDFSLEMLGPSSTTSIGYCRHALQAGGGLL